MEISYQLTEDDYRQGFKAFRRRTRYRLWLSRVSYVCLVFIGALAVFVPIFGLDRSVPNLLLLWGTAAFGIWCLWYAPRYLAKKMMRGSPGASLPQTLDISDDGLYFRTSSGESRLAWDLFIGWAEADRVFVLLPSPVTFIPIPKRAMVNDQQLDLRTLLRQKIPSGKQISARS